MQRIIPLLIATISCMPLLGMEDKIIVLPRNGDEIQNYELLKVNEIETFTNQPFSELITDEGANFKLARVQAGGYTHYFHAHRLNVFLQANSRSGFPAPDGFPISEKYKNPLNQQPIENIDYFREVLKTD